MGFGSLLATLSIAPPCNGEHQASPAGFYQAERERETHTAAFVQQPQPLVCPTVKHLTEQKSIVIRWDEMNPGVRVQADTNKPNCLFAGFVP